MGRTLYVKMRFSSETAGCPLDDKAWIQGFEPSPRTVMEGTIFPQELRVGKIKQMYKHQSHSECRHPLPFHFVHTHSHTGTCLVTHVKVNPGCGL